MIKGWDIGVAGMSVGGERRITVPAPLAYGNKSLPGIPANSQLIFDVKLLEIKWERRIKDACVSSSTWLLEFTPFSLRCHSLVRLQQPSYQGMLYITVSSAHMLCPFSFLFFQRYPTCIGFAIITAGMRICISAYSFHHKTDGVVT